MEEEKGEPERERRGMKSALSIRCQATLNTNEAGFDNLLITPACVCASEMAALLTEAMKEPPLRQAQSRDKEKDLLLKAGGLGNTHTHTCTHAHTGRTKDLTQ